MGGQFWGTAEPHMVVIGPLLLPFSEDSISALLHPRPRNGGEAEQNCSRHMAACLSEDQFLSASEMVCASLLLGSWLWVAHGQRWQEGCSSHGPSLLFLGFRRCPWQTLGIGCGSSSGRAAPPEDPAPTRRPGLWILLTPSSSSWYPSSPRGFTCSC